MDSSFVYALYNAKDSNHTRAKDFAAGYKGGTIIPDVVLPEVAYLFTRDVRYQGVQTFLANFKRVSNSLEALQPAEPGPVRAAGDWRRDSALLKRAAKNGAIA